MNSNHAVDSFSDAVSAMRALWVLVGVAVEAIRRDKMRSALTALDAALLDADVPARSTNRMAPAGSRVNRTGCRGGPGSRKYASL